LLSFEQRKRFLEVSKNALIEEEAKNEAEVDKEDVKSVHSAGTIDETE
jgi:hypothetical protein